MKRSILKPFLVVSFATALFSCGGNTETAKEEPKKEADTVAVTTTAPAPAAFTPFDYAEISHTVKDYAKWRPFFDADSVNRKAIGMTNLVVGKGIDNANHIVIYQMLADVQKAKGFSTDPKVKEVMEKAGVISKPVIQLFHAIRFNEESKEKNWIVITHKVKDFDAWVKVYDGEGLAQRASEGMVDVVLARGIDDPSIVQIVFDITDMAKAKAAIGSEAKKKLMMSAGVEGKPSIEFYQTAE